MTDTETETEAEPQDARTLTPQNWRTARADIVRAAERIAGRRNHSELADARNMDLETYRRTLAAIKRGVRPYI